MTTQESPPIRIPRSYYRDDEIFDRELANVFARTWVMVAHESELPQTGDYVTRLMGGDPVVVSRTEAVGIKVMLNSCTHRGTSVCKVAHGNSTTFRCGYHGWVFGNDGALKGVPGRRNLYGADFDVNKLGLKQARVQSLHGFIFATWDEAAPDLRDYLGEFAWYFDALMDFFPGGLEVYGGVHRVVVRGNWKIHTENVGGDGYHLKVAHRTMFDMGVVGKQGGLVEGSIVHDPNGHSLRVQHLAEEGVPDTVFGYEDELVESARAAVNPEIWKFRSKSTVVHGCVFPNLVFVNTAPEYLGEDAQGMTAFLQIRVLTPVDQHHHEVAYWVVVPSSASDEWKRKSYQFATRQHGAAAFFEADDLENFRQIDVGLGAAGGSDVPFNYELGLGASEPTTPRWAGPGTIVGQDFSESSHRNFAARYIELMDSEG